MRRLSAVLFSLLTLTACGTTPTGSTVPEGSDVLLRPGESVTVEGTGSAVRFDAVAQDSRCPADVVCVTMGDAEAIFTVTQADSPSVQLTLHTAPGDGRRATVGMLSLALIHLDPYPYSSRPIEPQGYRASLRVERTPGS